MDMAVDGAAVIGNELSYMGESSVSQCTLYRFTRHTVLVSLQVRSAGWLADEPLPVAFAALVAGRQDVINMHASVGNSGRPTFYCVARSRPVTIVILTTVG